VLTRDNRPHQAHSADFGVDHLSHDARVSKRLDVSSNYLPSSKQRSEIRTGSPSAGILNAGGGPDETFKQDLTTTTVGIVKA